MTTRTRRRPRRRAPIPLSIRETLESTDGSPKGERRGLLLPNLPLIEAPSRPTSSTILTASATPLPVSRRALSSPEPGPVPRTQGHPHPRRRDLRAGPDAAGTAPWTSAARLCDVTAPPTRRGLSRRGATC